MGNGLARELREVKPAEPVTLPPRDVRASRRPLLLGSLLRFETLRRQSRVTALGTLDVLGLILAFATALYLKQEVKGDPGGLSLSFHQARDQAPLACLV